MSPVEFPQQNRIFGKDQPEYLPLPALEVAGSVITCWQCTPEDLAEINRTGKVWARQLTGGGLLQPQQITATPPFTILPG